MSTETETKHTPGPWAIHDMWPDDVIDATGSLVVSAYGDFESPTTQANARLIAAAPDLLEALEEIVRVMRANPQTDAITLLDAVECAEAAIRKAKGGQ